MLFTGRRFFWLFFLQNDLLQKSDCQLSDLTEFVLITWPIYVLLCFQFLSILSAYWTIIHIHQKSYSVCSHFEWKNYQKVVNFHILTKKIWKKKFYFSLFSKSHDIIHWPATSFLPYGGQFVMKMAELKEFEPVNEKTLAF